MTRDTSPNGERIWRLLQAAGALVRVDSLNHGDEVLNSQGWGIRYLRPHGSHSGVYVFERIADGQEVIHAGCADVGYLYDAAVLELEPFTPATTPTPKQEAR